MISRLGEFIMSLPEIECCRLTGIEAWISFTTQSLLRKTKGERSLSRPPLIGNDQKLRSKKLGLAFDHTQTNPAVAAYGKPLQLPAIAFG
jgi:hypothetical protein